MVVAGLIYRVSYSNTPVFELVVDGVAVMRRKNDSYMNATQILKAAGIEKRKRAKILDREVLIGDHQKVQGGFGKYQGTWIPLETARQLAERHGIYHRIQPLLEIDPADHDLYPEKEATAARDRKSAGLKTIGSPSVVTTPFSTDSMLIDNESIDWTDHDTVHTDDPGHVQLQQNFMLHVDAAMGRVKNVEMLLSQGVDPAWTNNAGETALMQAVKNTYCYDTDCFSRMLLLLYDTIQMVDHDGRTALHHAVAFAANETSDAAYPAAMHYVKHLIARGQPALLSIKDLNGDSAIDAAMRSGLDAVAQVLLTNGHLQPASQLQVSHSTASTTSKRRNLVSSVQRVIDTMDTEYIAKLRERDHALEKAQGLLWKASRQLQHVQGKLQEKEQKQQHNPSTASLEQCNMTREQWLEDQMKRLQSQVTSHAQTRQVLSQQIEQLQQRTSETEIQCKRLISACCNLPMDKVDILLEPMLSAVESDPPDNTFQQVVGFMDSVTRRRQQ